MNALGLIAAVISAIAGTGAGLLSWSVQRRTGRVSELDMQYSWALKRIDILEKDIVDLTRRATNAEERANNFERQLVKCEESRESVKVQNVLLQRLLDGRPQA